MELLPLQYISCRINQTPISAREISKIFHLDNTSATKGCKNAITIINTNKIYIKAKKAILVQPTQTVL